MQTGLCEVQDENAGAGLWLRLTVQKVGGVASISLVQLSGQQSSWNSLENTWGAAWETSHSPAPPLNLRVVLTDGSEVLLASISALQQPR